MFTADNLRNSVLGGNPACATNEGLLKAFREATTLASLTRWYKRLVPIEP